MKRLPVHNIPSSDVLDALLIREDGIAAYVEKDGRVTVEPLHCSPEDFEDAEDCATLHNHLLPQPQPPRTKWTAAQVAILCAVITGGLLALALTHGGIL